MIDVINNIQQSLPLLLLRGGVLLAIAFSAAFLLRRRAQHVRIVWATATLLLLALPMLQPLQVWHLPTVDLVTEKVPAPIAIPAPASPAEEMRIEPLPAVSGSIPVDDTVKPPTETPTTAAPQEITPREPRPWLPVLWLAGACLGLAYLALGRLVLWHLRTRREPANTPWLESLDAVAKETGTDVGGRIFFVPGIGMPLTAGILSPEIWLPETARDFGSRHRRSVLRHELAHIRGRDALWQLLSSLALASQWMNPLAWVAARSFRLAQERVCDDLALGAEDTAGEEYAHLLLEVARNAARRTDFRMTYAPTLMMAKNSSLKKRIKLILDKNMKRTAITKSQAWLTAALAAALVLPMALIGGEKKSLFVPDPSDPNLDIPAPASPKPTGRGVAVFTENDPLPEGDAVISYVMKLSYIKPDEAVRTFTQIIDQFGAFGSIAAVPNAASVTITEKTSLIRKLIDLKAQIDKPSSQVATRFITVKYANVTELAATLNELLGETSPDQKAPPVQIIPDPLTNRIFAMGRPVDLLFVEGLVREFDTSPDQRNFLRRKLKFLAAADFLPIAGDALKRAFSGTETAESPSQRQLRAFSGTGTAESPSQRQFPGGSARSDPQDNSAPESLLVGRTLLVADKITNSIVVQGHPSDIEIIEKLLDQVDVKAP